MFKFNPEQHIDVTGHDLVAMVKKAYDLSKPQGLGFLHATQGGLSDDEAKQLIAETSEDHYAVSLDYVRGRALKFNVRRSGSILFVDKRWYDHSDAALQELLATTKAAA